MATAFALMPVDNDVLYISRDAPAEVFCRQCGCVVDASYRPASIELRVKRDFSYTLDGRIILSRDANQFLEDLGIDGLIARPIASRNATMYVLDTSRIVEFDTTRRPVVFEDECLACGQFLDVHHALPAYLKRPGEIRPMTLAKTDLISGYKDGKSPVFLVGSQLMAAMKASGLSGMTFDPVRE